MRSAYTVHCHKLMTELRIKSQGMVTKELSFCMSNATIEIMVVLDKHLQGKEVMRNRVNRTKQHEVLIIRTANIR